MPYGVICPKCGKGVYSKSQVTPAGKSWHPDCFTCAKCSKPLAEGSFVEQGTEVYCKGHACTSTAKSRGDDASSTPVEEPAKAEPAQPEPTKAPVKSKPGALPAAEVPPPAEAAKPAQAPVKTEAATTPEHATPTATLAPEMPAAPAAALAAAPAAARDAAEGAAPKESPAPASALALAPAPAAAAPPASGAVAPPVEDPVKAEPAQAEHREGGARAAPTLVAAAAKAPERLSAASSGYPAAANSAQSPQPLQPPQPPAPAAAAPPAEEPAKVEPTPPEPLKAPVESKPAALLAAEVPRPAEVAEPAEAPAKTEAATTLEHATPTTTPAAPAAAPATAADAAEGAARIRADSPPKMFTISGTLPPEKDLETEVIGWIEHVTGKLKGDQTFGDWLDDGQVLCRLANKIEVGLVPNIHNSKMPFKKMENVTFFIKACRKFGVYEKELFSTPDLAEQKNLKSVQRCVHNLGSKIRGTAPNFHGPYLGVEQKVHVTDFGGRKLPHRRPCPR